MEDELIVRSRIDGAILFDLTVGDLGTLVQGYREAKERGVGRLFLSMLEFFTGWVANHHEPTRS